MTTHEAAHQVGQDTEDRQGQVDALLLVDFSPARWQVQRLQPCFGQIQLPFERPLYKK